jgi:hypothetical protein
MLADFIRMTSSTGGSSTLTCSAQTGYPIVSKVFTGTRFIQYAINEYTSSAKTQLSKSETGIGSYNTSTEVLTRTLVQSTWDGTDYRPKFGTATAPAALSFGSTSANIDIIISPDTGAARGVPPAVMGAIASTSDGYGIAPLNFTGASSSFTPTSGTIMYFPVELPYAQYSQVAFRQVTATTGGSPTVDVDVFETNQSDGLPGKLLAAFTQKAVGGGNTNYQTTALATPVPFGGWVWCGFLFLVGGGSGGTFRSVTSVLGGMWGTLIGSAVGPVTLASQTAFTDPATAPTSNWNSNIVPLVVFK